MNTDIYAELQKNKLFSRLDIQAIKFICNNCNAQLHVVDAGNYVVHTGDKACTGFVLDGAVDLLREEFSGQATFVGRVYAPDIFGEVVDCLGKQEMPLSVRAYTHAQVVTLELSRLFHIQTQEYGIQLAYIIASLMQVLARKCVVLRSKVEILSQRSIREKLQLYIKNLSMEQHCQSFIQENKSYALALPFNRQELANYLSVNRSALSKELAKLKQERLIDYTQKNFYILKPYDFFQL